MFTKLAGAPARLGRNVIGLSVAGLIAAASGPAAAQEASSTIETADLGAVYALTGPVAIYSTTIQNALKMALEDVNGMDGPKLDIALEDDRSNKNDAINVYQKFIQRDQKLLIFGPLIGSQTFAAAPLAQRAGVPVMLTSVATPGVTDIGDYIFRTSVESATIIPSTVEAAVDKLGIETVAQIYTNDDQFSIGEYEAFDGALTENGVEILGVETIRTGDVDFSAQLTKIKSLDPDAIVISSQGEESVGLMTQARELGIDAVFLGGNAFNSSGVLKDAGEAMENAMSATPWFASQENEANLEFVKRYREMFDADPDWLAAQTYDAVMIVKQAVDAAGITPDDGVADARTKLRDALAAIETYDGVLGKIEFTDNGDPVVPGAVLQVKNGKHELVE
ncbi:ABC transporter substrate-binding protein [Aquicoccus sp. SCR17]|nr:ABC transporter substrate-binding protein [Carideicomes alvinocaridis]